MAEIVGIWLLIMVLVVVAVVVGFPILFVVFCRRESKRQNRLSTELGAVATISVGKYLAGLPDAVSLEPNVLCFVLTNDFAFISGSDKEIGRIPRNSINQISVVDKSVVTQRLTVSRMLTLGVFSLAAPKNKKQSEFCVLIDWDNDIGIRQDTIFEFSNLENQNQPQDKYAYSAANVLQKYVLPKVHSLKPDEKKCPFCAEAIKKEATKCRFCGSAV
jgi:hypothetical protein